MDKYLIKNRNERLICMIDGCGKGHRHNTHHLCCKHKILLEFENKQIDAPIAPTQKETFPISNFFDEPAFPKNELNLDDKWGIGKHQNRTVRDILTNEWQYVCWVVKENAKLSNEQSPFKVQNKSFIQLENLARNWNRTLSKLN